MPEPLSDWAPPRRTFPHRGAARAALFGYIEALYNSHRRDSALGYLLTAAYDKGRPP